MKKLALNLEKLQVESFSTSSTDTSRGTVRAQSEFELIGAIKIVTPIAECDPPPTPDCYRVTNFDSCNASCRYSPC